MGARRVRRVHPAAGLAYLVPIVVSEVCEQPWCRCMRDADCAWLLMVVVGSRFFLFPCMWCAALVVGWSMARLVDVGGTAAAWARWTMGMAVAMIGSE